MNSKTVFNSNTNSDPTAWTITNDVVMGGLSTSSFCINANGHGVFSGHVSLENNGGFASVRHQFHEIVVTPATKIKIKLKGDGKDYQFRVKHDITNYYSYTTRISTTGKWQEVIIPLKDLHPVFRGKRLELPNFDHTQLAQIVFLIGNKKDEDFELQIDNIEII